MRNLFAIGMICKQVSLLGLIVIFLFPVTTGAEIPLEHQNRLKHMIRHDCGACHGMTLKGGLGPPLTVDAMQTKSSDVLFNIIMNGVEGKPMPPWNRILNEQEVFWIVEQLKTGLSDE